MSPSAWEIYSCKSFPSLVKYTPFVLREKRRTCSCSSSCLMDWLTADWEMNRFCAAAEMFPMRATSWKTR